MYYHSELKNITKVSILRKNEVDGIMLKFARTKETFFEKIENKAESTILSYKSVVSSFESFSMEKHGKANIIPDMLESSDQDVFDILQSWINWTAYQVPYTLFATGADNYWHYYGV